MEPETERSIPSRYDPSQEDSIYALWEGSGYFNPDNLIKDGIADISTQPFSVVLPPPNVTGTLHIGHAFEDTIQDIIVRYARMQGRPTVWIPGTDHAAIATQSKVEKALEKEGKKKYDLGREEFLKRVDAFAKESHDTIVRQVRRLGASLDWDREAYTLDEKRNLAVRTAFKRMYDAELIYRGHRVVNWDPKGQTVISDDEIVYEERKAKLYTLKYSADFPIAISTTRPETKFGDTAVAVHPDDPRYKEFVGKEYDMLFCGHQIHIKIIADQSVEKEFGTGALGVTPAHSMIDWEIAQRHNLPLIQVINEHGKMMVGPEAINGKKTAEAREATVNLLKEAGLIQKEEEITQNVSTAERTGGIIEPLPKLQWFVAVNKEFIIENSKIKDIPSGSKTTLKEIMRKAVVGGDVAILPERFERTYYHWIENLRDWCISRQIWFGHQIPAWYKKGSSEVYVNIEPPSDIGSWEQDSDTLDTWFSSGMWTFSTLGWPQDTEDMRRFHPNTFMAPGYEILFFWVARMILMSGFLLGDIPFKTVVLHGIVRDKDGRKFSKSLGNGIDPLVLANTYGADALRMALIAGAAPGNDVKFSEDKVRGYRNFSTKVWNVARFVFMNRKPEFLNENPVLSSEDTAYLEEFANVRAQITAHIEKYEFHLAADLAYHYFWHTFADKIIEAMKPRLQGTNLIEAAAAYKTAETILLGSLTILHPFTPFVTETIYQEMLKENLLPSDSPKLLMIRKWDA